MRPDATKAKMTAAKFRQSRETIEKAVISRQKTVELRRQRKEAQKKDGK